MRDRVQVVRLSSSAPPASPQAADDRRAPAGEPAAGPVSAVLPPRGAADFARVPLGPPDAIAVSEPEEPAEREAEHAAGVVAHRLAGSGSADAPVVLGPAAPRLWRAADAGSPSIASAGLVVDDDAQTLTAGQMRKSELLAALRIEACAAVDRALAEVGRNTRGCPHVERWLSYYAGRPAQHLERALRKYAPEARSASAARDYIRPVSARLGRGARAWAQTGRLPADVPDELRQAGAGGGVLGAAAAIGGAITGALSGIGRAIGGLFAKPQGGGAQLAVDRAALNDRLGPGRPIDGAVRTRMESAFAADFAHVRVHDDGRAAALSGDLRARAFTLGDHVAFGPGEYRPGTLAGDALIAHELAHVVQQSGAAVRSQPAVDATPAPALEAEADEAAAAAVIDMHGGRRRQDRRRRELGRQRGLRLQRCGTDLRQGTQLPTSAQQTNVRAALHFPIASTHAAGAPAPPTPAGVSASAAAASTEWAGAKHPGDTPQQTALADTRRAEIEARLMAGVTAEFNRQLQSARATQTSARGTSVSEFEGAANAARHVVDDRYSDWRDPRVGVGAPRPGEFQAGANLRSSYDRPQNDPTVFATPETRVYNLATYSGPNGAPSVASTLRDAPYYYDIDRSEGLPENSESAFFQTRIVTPFVNAHRSDLNLITQYNYAVTDIAGGTVYISPSSPSADAKWSAFKTTVHEYLHVLEHPIFQRTANKPMSEGFTEYFTAQALTALPLETARMNDTLRREVEAPNPGPPGRLRPYETVSQYRDYLRAAQRAKSELGSDPGAENAMRGAFFQGHVELVGFDPRHPGAPGPVRSPNLAPGMREHIVIAVGGVAETGEMIARIHDVKLADLQRANPGVNLSALHAGDRVLVPRS